MQSGPEKAQAGSGRDCRSAPLSRPTEIVAFSLLMCACAPMETRQVHHHLSYTPITPGVAAASTFLF